MSTGMSWSTAVDFLRRHGWSVVEKKGDNHVWLRSPIGELFKMRARGAATFPVIRQVRAIVRAGGAS